MNTTTQAGPLEVRLSVQFGRISPTALQDATKAVQALGCSMAQAAHSLQAVVDASKVLDPETEKLKRAGGIQAPMVSALAAARREHLPGRNCHAVPAFP